MTERLNATALLLAMTWALAACSGGSVPGNQTIGADPITCAGDCATASSFLSESDVRLVIARAVAEAQAHNRDVVVAVVDRVGNVLGVYDSAGSNPTVDVRSSQGIIGGLDGINATVPASLGAISKAITAAYLSTEGHAFSTRTASQIVQQHFNPGERDQPAGPLFGVQFSQLACSDLVQRDIDDAVAARPGPKRSPLGLSADSGGFPLYRGGTPIGAVGVIADGVYGNDADVQDYDTDIDELIAFAATFGMAAPLKRRANRIAVDGKVLRFSDIDFSDTRTGGNNVAPIGAATGLAVNGYTDGSYVDGTAFGFSDSGIRPSAVTDSIDLSALDAFVLVDNSNAERFPLRAGTAPPSAPISAAEAGLLLRAALGVAAKSRAQIRQPLGSSARVSIAIVDAVGEVLALARTRDAPVFGTDVALQKARTATFFSSADAGSQLSNAGSVSYVQSAETVVFADYVTAARQLLGSDALNGGHAFADRSGGNLSRPYFPDGLTGNPHGPFSKPISQWSVFSSGLQLDIAYERVIEHILYAAAPPGTGTDVARPCGGVAGSTTVPSTANPTRLGNGLQIFPGSVPVYRGNQLVGGIGVSGDGVDQDDMIAFLAAHETGLTTTLGNAPAAIRADNLVPAGIRLRYIQCPFAPFINSDEATPCNGK